MRLLLRLLIISALSGLSQAAIAQLQACPVNINFSKNDLSNWSASTGLMGGNSINYTLPNGGLTAIPEYTMSTTGIEVITTSTEDRFGKFQTIPVVNGYSYDFAVKLGSTATSRDLNASGGGGGNGGQTPGGFVRSITYEINVPAGPATVPYTMTYAYALVLENGTHNSDDQPLFKAVLKTADSIITCASPHYYLPTLNNATRGNGNGSTGATLDSGAAIANGFVNSPEPFLSFGGGGGNGGGGNGGGGNSGNLLNDVWTKEWTEVTFDLSPYRGRQVTLTFEANNCRPGAHFAYAYIALRNTCGGLEISGPGVACTNNSQTYSIPALAGGTYNWIVPAGWSIVSGAGTNKINVIAGTNGGKVIAQQFNSCANLKDTLEVTTSPPTVAGTINSDNTVCEGINFTSLSSTGSVGTIISWLSSSDGVTWTRVNSTAGQYNAQNLTRTTHYAALVQNGSACSIDTARKAVITVNLKSDAGNLLPSNNNICLDQPVLPNLQLAGATGDVINWQQSFDNAGWNNFSPTYSQKSFQPTGINTTNYYRAIVKNGVCPQDTSDVAVLRYFNVKYPSAQINPDSISICYGKTATLNATINIGTNYTWSNPAIVSGGNASFTALPYAFTASAAPVSSTKLVLIVNNAGCPNAFRDTVRINVISPVKVFAGNDTAVIVGQPLQLNAKVNKPDVTRFAWSPTTGLQNTAIANPLAVYNDQSPASILYRITATTSDGCEGSDDIMVKIFKTGTDIFMPSAFTPNGDGRNDQIIPICVGIKQLNYFRVYNRWGQLIYSTSMIGSGWDGRLKGSVQGASNYVYVVQGVDYTGRVITKRGNVVLVR